MRRAIPCLLALCVLQAAVARADERVSARLRAGPGVAQRAISAPGREGPRELELGPVPAFMLGIDSDAHTGDWVLGLGLSYRTSMLGRVADVDAGPGAASSKTAVRSHNFEAGLRAGLQLGSREHPVLLGLFAGYDVRALATVAVLRMPRFTLHGPSARIEIELPLRAANMRLLIGPEAQWIASVSRALLDTSQLVQPVFALGGLLQLKLPLGEKFGLQLDYRESHVFARASAAHNFSDVERYLLLAAALRVP